MKDNRYGVALIGCGQMGAAHLDDIHCKDNVILRYVCDINKDRAYDFMHRYHAQKFTVDYLECITDPEVDIVIIATYPSTHLMILKECLKNKKHVLCEKPMTTTLEEAEQFAELVNANPDCKVLVGHILRHNITYNRVRQMIQDDAIGSPLIMRMVQNHHTMDWNKYLSLIKDTSPLIDCGVHYIDVMQWFTGSKISSVSGIGLRNEPDVPIDKCNYELMTVTLEDGSIGYYEVGWSNTMSSDNLKEFVGPKGRIRIVYRKDRTSHQEEGDMIEYYRYPEKTYEIININSKRKPTGAQLDWLITMISENAPAKPTMDEVLEAFRLAVKADAIIRKEYTARTERLK